MKSVNLDSWTPEQVVNLQQMGNSKARAVYEATLPDSWRRPQTDLSLEHFIRAKYQHKRYIAKEWVPPPIPKVIFFFYQCNKSFEGSSSADFFFSNFRSIGIKNWRKKLKSKKRKKKTNLFLWLIGNS